MKRLLVSVTVAMSLAVVGCAPSAPPPAPTTAPAAAKTGDPTKAAAPTVAPTAAPTAQPAAAPAKATFPEKGKAITFIVPWAAGGGADVSARQFAPLLEKQLGIPVQVVNREGASSQVGLTELVRSKPDGYTILVASLPSSLPTYLDAQRKAIYTRESFQPIGVYRSDPYVLVVKADGPYKSVKDLVDAAKAAPEKVKISSAGGVLSASHLSMLLLEKAAGVKLAIVLMDGGGPAATALLGGHVDASIGSAGAYMAQVKSNELRVIGVADTKDSKLFPDAKTFTAQGYPIVMSGYSAIVTPAGTPKEVADVLSDAVKRVVDSGELDQKLEAVGSVARYLGPDELAKLWADMEQQIKPFIEEFRTK